jgi:hypothetical protein
MIARKSVGSAQLWRCVLCAKRFLDPTARRGRRGPAGGCPQAGLRERVAWLKRRYGWGNERIAQTLGINSKSVARLMSGRATGGSGSGTTGRLEIQIRHPLVESLAEMFRTSNGWGADRGDLAQFAAEIVENAIAEYRANRRLAITPLVSPPPDPETPASLRRFKYQRILSPRDIEQIHNLFRSGLRQSAIAARFNVKQSTVSRHLDGTAHGHLNGNA